VGSSPRGTTASRWRTRASGSTTRPGAWSGSATPGACESPEELAGYRDAFFDALADDFNTPRALAAMADWIREANRVAGPVGDSHLREMLGVLGLENLLEACASRDFAESDRLRDELRAVGWEVRDGPAGQELVPIGP